MKSTGGGGDVTAQLYSEAEDEGMNASCHFFLRVLPNLDVRPCDSYSCRVIVRSCSLPIKMPPALTQLRKVCIA